MFFFFFQDIPSFSKPSILENSGMFHEIKDYTCVLYIVSQSILKELKYDTQRQKTPPTMITNKSILFGMTKKDERGMHL